MKFLAQVAHNRAHYKFIYNNAESPSDDPQAERLAAAAEFSAERNDLSAEVIEAAMGIARAVDGLNVDTTSGEFVLADPFSGRSDGTTFRLPLGRIPDAGMARQVVDRYVFLSNNGNIDIDGEAIYYMADVDHDDETVIDADRLEAILLDPNTPGGIQEYQAFLANPVPLGNVAPADPAPVAVVEAPVVPVLPAVSAAPDVAPSTDPVPDRMSGDLVGAMGADSLPPVAVRSEAEILEAIQDPQSPLSAEEIGYLEDFEIVERLIGYPTENAGIQEALFQRLLAMNDGALTRAACDNLAQRSHYFMMSRNPNFALTEEVLSDQLFGIFRASQGLEAVEGSHLDETQRAEIETLLGAADAAIFLESRPPHETPSETMAMGRTLSIFKGQIDYLTQTITEKQNTVDGLRADFESGEAERRNHALENGPLYAQLNYEIPRLEDQRTTYQEAYADLLAGDIEPSDQAIRDLIDQAGAAEQALAITSHIEDDGIAALEVSEADKARLGHAKTFIDAFAQFRRGQDELYNQAYQALNNNDVLAVEAVLEKMLDGSVRSWWHNMWGNETYQTARSEAGLEDRPDITAASIMNDPGALAQALREIEAFDAAEAIILQTTQAELTTENADLTPAESEVLTTFHDQLFTENGDFNYESSAATAAAQQVDAMLARLIVRDENGNIIGGVDPIGGAALEAQRDSLIVSGASSAVFESTINQYLGDNPDNVDGLSHLMNVYSDMTGIGGEWNNFSDSNLNLAREAGLFVGGFFIPFGAITGMMAKIGKTVNMARRATVAKVTSAAARVVQGPGDEIARAAAGGAGFIDDAIRVGASSVDDVARIAPRLDDLDDVSRGVLNELKNLQRRTSAKAQEAFNARRSSLARTLNVGDDVIDDLLRQLDEVPHFSSVAPSVSDDIGSLAFRGADDVATHADDPLPLTRPHVVDDGIMRPPQALARPALAMSDDTLRLADQVTPQTLRFEVGGHTFTRGDKVLYQTADGNTLERYIVGKSADGGVMLRHTPLDDVLMQADTPVDDLYRAAQMRVVRPDALARITRFSDIPAPRVASTLDVPQGFVPRIVGGTDTLPATRITPAHPPTVKPNPLPTAVAPGRLPSAIPAAVARPSLSAMAVPPVILGGAAAANMDFDAPNINPLVEDTPRPPQISPDLMAPNPERPITPPEVSVEAPAPVPTLAEQMEAIGSTEIRGKANEIRAILAEHQNYTLGDWQNISDEIATLYGLELTTEEDRIAFGNQIQAQIRSILDIADSNEDLEDGKIGRESMRYLDRALLSVSQSEITNQAEALQNFEAQAGGWRANNRAMAEMFGINFAEDATDTQLKVFGRSIQAFAGGNDGAIGNRTIGRLHERLAALETA